MNMYIRVFEYVGLSNCRNNGIPTVPPKIQISRWPPPNHVFVRKPAQDAPITIILVSMSML